MKEHVKSIKNHVKELSSKQYWKYFSPSPEYVVLFLLAESLFSSALQVDPSLLEYSVKENIIIATPTTLIAILRAVAYGWKQENIKESTYQIAKIGKELHQRLLVMTSYWQKLGKNISSSVDLYNQIISSLESRVLVSARKLSELGAVMGDKDIENLQEINKTTCSKRSAALDESSDFSTVEK